jgi:hypothetical protein
MVDAMIAATRGRPTLLRHLSGMRHSCRKTNVVCDDAHLLTKVAGRRRAPVEPVDVVSRRPGMMASLRESLVRRHPMTLKDARQLIQGK